MGSSRLGHLVDALRKLSPNQRAAVVLGYEADLPEAKVARRNGDERRDAPGWS